LRWALGAIGLAGVALAGRSLLAASVERPPSGYGVASADDTLRARLTSARAAERRGREALGAIVLGYLSPRGLPPMQGALVVTDTGLVFRSADGRYASTLPVVGPVRHSPQGRWRASAVSLAYVDDALGRRSYLFRVEGGVFETDAPGALMDVAAHPTWLDSLGSREWTSDRPLLHATSPGEMTALVDIFMRGTYADTLYAVFGRPTRRAGLVGERGRAIGRLGEYVATRDSLALDPGRMSSLSQLRHTLAHELAHRWQGRAAAQLAALWQGVPTIRDPKRYGYDNLMEHQAEAAAFAIHFLLATAAPGDTDGELGTLDHYDLLVPGTRTLARYFVMQPTLDRHPLRTLLTTGRAR